MRNEINGGVAGKQRTIIAASIVLALGLGSVNDEAAADVLTFSFVGQADSGSASINDALFTMLDPAGVPLTNTSKPYYYDATWGYGVRAQISGTLTLDTVSGTGSGAIDPFEFFGGGRMAIHDIALQTIGDGSGGSGTLIAGSFLHDWRSNLNVNSGIVWDATGLLSAISGGLSIGDAVGAGCLGCGLPASDGISSGKYPIGPIPLATTSLDTDFHNGGANIIGDDGIGGSPQGASSWAPGFSINLDFAKLTLVDVQPSPIPVPAAAWLFGTGLLGLLGVARRKRQD